MTTEESREGATPEGRTVLLVEDDEDHRTIYRTMLQRAGFRVVECGDGPSALACTVRHPPDVILMDIGLPGMDGWEAARRLRAGPGTRAIPVIALTAHVLPSDRARARQLGFAGFIAKPGSPLQVVREVRSLLRGAER